ncbi:dihydrolipoyl dehydrogenase [Clostridium sp. YIM B02515]|uniref:Dihydrolipoyl dehydrogenase n=1 Tax=Clostridium rhizosphaerae TaxID=2803861 RepID=A0ABS1T9K2_9CLOT|nr:dihydrolipoyl dehydrogenase [Clostridium rhizosphaerae]MBL4936028.1 dihydrolipoyl dehydrogenase [Clostridium rhizosphaerae]
MKEYDIVVLGGGPGGYVAAIKAAQLGAKTALIEKENVGGVCLNVGCIPTKTLLKSAKVYEDIMHSEKFGIDILDRSSININLDNLMKRKDSIVNKLTGGVKVLLKQNGVEVYNGYGEALDKNTLLVNGETLKTKNLIIATGSSTFIPNTKGLKEAFEKGYAITSTEALTMDKIPENFIVIGGGVVGVEFAALYNALGSKVTILQRSQILRSLDKDVREAMEKILRSKGINIVYGVDIEKYENNKVICKVNGEKKIYEGDKILISIGRTPNLKGIEKLNLKLDKKGIVTDEKLRTNIEGIYAIGDVNGKYMLAHVASAEGIAAVENIMGKEEKINYDKVPSCIYTFPEVGVVGLSEEEARERGHKVITSTFPMTANGKAMAEGETDGFVKIVADEQYGEVLGVHIIASHATDMIAEAVTTLELEGTVYDLAKAVHPHPTLSEVVMEAAHGAIGKPIHIFKK